MIQQGARFGNQDGILAASSVSAFSRLLSEAASEEPSVIKGEQSNSSVKFGSRAILKLYRRCEQGINPDLEIGRVLTERGFGHSPAVLGALEYIKPDQEPSTMVLVQSFIENQGDVWQYTVGELERVVDSGAAERMSTIRPTSGSTHQSRANGAYVELAATLGRRTAELHLALGPQTGDPAFAPEDCTLDYWRALRTRMERSIEGALLLLRRRLSGLGDAEQRQAALVFALERQLLTRVGAPANRNPEAQRIRCHGDYHLGQVLYTGRDFMIIDFEGEPARPLAERRAKHVPVVDVAGMVRSFHYAAYAALQRLDERAGGEPCAPELEERARRWYQSAAAAFVAGYAETAADAPFWPASAEERAMLLDAHLIEKACYELSYELNNRPGWAGIPLKGILQLFESDKIEVPSGTPAARAGRVPSCEKA
jgi:trehalose synthase-fused probable maltokinase